MNNLFIPVIILLKKKERGKKTDQSQIFIP